jgi:hypothetical protein
MHLVEDYYETPAAVYLLGQMSNIAFSHFQLLYWFLFTRESKTDAAQWKTLRSDRFNNPNNNAQLVPGIFREKL